MNVLAKSIGSIVTRSDLSVYIGTITNRTALSITNLHEITI